MAKQPKKLPADMNRRAHAIGDIATGQAEAPSESAKAAAGRKGGLKGGKARAASMTSAELSDIAKRAAAARWKKSTDS